MKNYNLFKDINFDEGVKSRKGKLIGNLSKKEKNGIITGLVLTRPNGKLVSISRKSVENTLSRLLAGEELLFQTNASKGGISYTVAIEATIVYVLAPFIEVDEKNRVYKLKQA